MSIRVQNGSALIEAMVAVLVFSFGILALISMQTAAIRSTADAKYRADASFLANQIIGQMWGEAPASLVTYVNGSSATAVGATLCPIGGAAATAPAAITWLTEIAKLLPGADANRQQVTVAGDVVTVRLCWLDKSTTAGVYHNHVISAQINKNL
ncbi:type IV pilus modification protein PilV [Propionivibrio sp.]|uniref:type IV pilus modification protein PilV n=1 Tax=Propionivibrio sp. TaxID=2212460 RepID=UPI0025FD199E|nr:type IV pilus modification protein PilV [Propionivibrio sp.]MBK7357206.1 type IV pilus modification protein PilV [Propionivibrio sp.]MBK8401401.1 type IV pilus modification protein PilV [Propionivibrio sp.]MBK8745773.1 type IV pilus modification protein PilV [Propionivibrio sp.]MBK8892629.1 type IV pilus modification protein PilV [Propionivibrio sp.]MBL0208069.1 type IV pilus modification protein PilV [Propionivibrio sp.]